MGTALSIGTLVTVIYPDHCVLTHVVAWSGAELFRVASDGTPMDALYVADEGSTWIRGHHVPSSPVVEAAVTALALRGQIDESPASSINFGPLAAIIAGIGAPTKNVLMGALTGALGAALINHTKAKASKGPPPTRIYKKP